MKKPKKLKKIPGDIVSYVQQEGKAVRDARDKEMIVSYALGKLKIIDWYIALLDVNSQNYIVPHSYDYLTDMKYHLETAIETIAERPPPAKKGLLDFDYPEGYDG